MADPWHPASLGAAVAALGALGVALALAPAPAPPPRSPAAPAEALEALREARDLATLTLALTSPQEAPRPWTEALAAATEALPPDSTWARVELVDRQGSIVATQARSPQPARGPGCPDAVRTHPSHGARPAVVLTLARQCAVDTAPTPGARWPQGLAGLCALGAGLLAAGVLRRRDRSRAARDAALARRLAALTEATALVASGTRRLDLDPGPHDDAAAALTRAFVKMLDELSLVQSRVDALQRLAAWQDFARRLAHEIKNPLTPIQLAAQELARRYTGDDPRFRRTLETATEVIAEEVATLRRLVTAFSEFARLPEVKPAPGDLGEFVRDMAGSRAFVEEAGGGAAGVEVRFEAPEAPLPVRIDRIMLRRAVDNLLRNALQALRGRGGTVWVRAEPRDVPEPDGTVVPQAWLVVEDDGPGIPLAERDKVFEPYFTTKPEGTGLGLAIVRKVCLDHDGDVGLEARPDGGARFVLALPRAEPAGAAGTSRTGRSFVTFSRGPSSTRGSAPVRVAGTLPRHAATGDGADERAGDRMGDGSGGGERDDGGPGHPP